MRGSQASTSKTTTDQYIMEILFHHIDHFSCNVTHIMHRISKVHRIHKLHRLYELVNVYEVSTLRGHLVCQFINLINFTSTSPLSYRTLIYLSKFSMKNFPSNSSIDVSDHDPDHHPDPDPDHEPGKK